MMVLIFITLLFYTQLSAQAPVIVPHTQTAALFKAVEARERDKVKELLSGGAEANILESEEEFLLRQECKGKFDGFWNRPYRETVLNKAIWLCDAGIVEELLKAGADPNGGQLKPILQAASELDTAKTRLLLEYKADPNFEDSSFGTALYRAVYNQHSYYSFTRTDDTNGRRSVTVKLLLEYGADCNYSWLGYSSILEYACEFGNLEIIKLLLNYYKLDNKPDRELLQKAFVRAYKTNYQEALKLLLDKGISLEESGVPVLILLIKLNYLDKARELLDAGADPNQVDQEGYAPLMIAVRDGHVELVQQLLLKGADPNKKLASSYENDWGMQPLDFALEQTPRESQMTITELLLVYDADPNQLTQCGFTTLHRAVKQADIKLIKLLLKHKADPNIYSKNYDPLTPFQQAVLRSPLDIVKLLAENGADLILLTLENKWSAAELAATKGRLGILKYLLSKKIKLTSAQIGNCFLLACKGGFIGTVKFLLEKWPADCLNFTDKNGLTPLHMTVMTDMYRSDNIREDDIKIVKLLFEKGVSSNVQDNQGNSALHHIFMTRGGKDLDEQDAVIIELLLKNGAAINLPNNQGNTPLHVAVEHYYYWAERKIYLIKILLENGASLTHKNNNGETALFTAMGSDSDTAQFLLDIYVREHKDLDVHQKNNKGETLLHKRVATREYRPCLDSIKFLISQGADVNTQDNQGTTPLLVADDEEVKRLLLEHGAKA